MIISILTSLVYLVQHLQHFAGEDTNIWVQIKVRFENSVTWVEGVHMGALTDWLTFLLLRLDYDDDKWYIACHTHVASSDGSRNFSVNLV
jgi:hypothetical protein